MRGLRWRRCRQGSPPRFAHRRGGSGGVRRGVGAGSRSCGWVGPAANGTRRWRWRGDAHWRVRLGDTLGAARAWPAGGARCACADRTGRSVQHDSARDGRDGARDGGGAGGGGGARSGVGAHGGGGVRGRWLESPRCGCNWHVCQCSCSLRGRSGLGRDGRGRCGASRERGGARDGGGAGGGGGTRGDVGALGGSGV